MNRIRKSVSDVRGFCQIANAVRKGQKIETQDTPSGREYYIIVNR